MKIIKNRAGGLALLLSLTCLAGCTAPSQTQPGTSEPQAGTTSAVTTQTPTAPESEPELLPIGTIKPITVEMVPERFEVESGVDVEEIRANKQNLIKNYYLQTIYDGKGYDWSRDWETLEGEYLFDADPETKYSNVPVGISSPYLIWAMDQPVTVEGYIFQNPLEVASINCSKPQQFYLLGINEWQGDIPFPSTEEGLNGWHVLDFVGNTDMKKGSLGLNGFAVDKENQAPYQYYCLYIEWFTDAEHAVFEFSELELYGKAE